MVGLGDEEHTLLLVYASISANGDQIGGDVRSVVIVDRNTGPALLNLGVMPDPRPSVVARLSEVGPVAGLASISTRKKLDNTSGRFREKSGKLNDQLLVAEPGHGCGLIG